LEKTEKGEGGETKREKKFEINSITGFVFFILA